MYLDRRLWAFTRGVRLRIAGTVLLGLLAVGAGIARLALFGWLLGSVIAGDPLRSLLPLMALAVAAVVLRAALDYWRAMAAHHTAARVHQALRQAIYAHVTALAPPLIFAFVAFVDLPVALVLLAAALLTLIAPSIWHRKDSRKSLARQKAYSAFGAEFLDSVQGLATLKAFGQSSARGRLLEEKGHALFDSTMGVLGANTFARGITDTGMAVGAAVALGLGAWRVQTGEMSLGALLVVLMLGIEVFRPLRELRVVLHQGMLGISAAGGLIEILEAEPLVRDTVTPPLDRASLAPTVTFEGVEFSYPGGRRAAHDDLSFEVKAGERVGIVGPSGAGKSTIARLLLRFYDPGRGRVMIGGRDLRDLTLDQLRGLIAVVSQDTYLFHGTVAENLRMGKPDATPAELQAAARAANAEEFVTRLPQGYETVVGERGIRLSGGQRQRIAIARALLRDAPILVLDEALSSVDAESEALIQAALDRLMRGRTTLVFAHRLSSVVGADRTLVLDQGRLVEQGTHIELLGRGGAYTRLMAGQARDGAGAVAVSARPTALPADGDGAPPGTDGNQESADAIVGAEAVGWGSVLRTLLDKTRGYRGQLTLTFALGVARVTAFIGVGVLSALAVRAVKRGEPAGALLAGLLVVAPLAGILHWVESWLAHDVAYRLLTDMRLDVFRKLDALAPAYLTRRRSGDLVGAATHDVELIEYFFAHTITPAFVAVLVPAAVLVALGAYNAALVLVLVPFLLYTALVPVLGRGRIDRLGSRAREASGDLNAHVVDTVQGLAEIVAYRQVNAWGEALGAKARRYYELRLPFLRDLARQTAVQETAIGIGGLAVIAVGAWLAQDGRLDAGTLPLLTLLALSAFVPLWEVAQVGRQLADTHGAARRL